LLVRGDDPRSAPTIGRSFASAVAREPIEASGSNHVVVTNGTIRAIGNVRTGCLRWCATFVPGG
jgi:hypothetical protein